MGLTRTIEQAPRVLRRRAARLLFERGRLENTYGRVDLGDLGLDTRDRRPYEPSPWSHLRRALRDHPVGPDDVFLDLGAGKGRVVYQAARLSFRRVIGVEISEDLVAVARRNISRNERHLRCRDVELVCADVMDYEVPDDVTCAYLYNPFVGEPMRAAVRSLVESYDRRPRELTVIYANPHAAEEFVRAHRFELVRESRGRTPEELILVYRVTAPLSPGPP